MPGVKRNLTPRTFQVEVSFSALNKGERFTLNPGDLSDPNSLGWAHQLVQSGYLRDVTEEVAGDERGQEG